MNTTATHHQVVVGLAAALALIATIGSYAPVQATAHERGHTAQYCAPLEEASVDAHRFYCRSGRGWESGNRVASRASVHTRMA